MSTIEIIFFMNSYLLYLAATDVCGHITFKNMIVCGDFERNF